MKIIYIDNLIEIRFRKFSRRPALCKTWVDPFVAGPNTGRHSCVQTCPHAADITVKC